MIRVTISDRGDWNKTYRAVETWLYEHYRECVRATVGMDHDMVGWDFDFGMDTIDFLFADPKIAMAFKLTWA